MKWDNPLVSIFLYISVGFPAIVKSTSIGELFVHRSKSLTQPPTRKKAFCVFIFFCRNARWVSKRESLSNWSMLIYRKISEELIGKKERFSRKEKIVDFCPYIPIRHLVPFFVTKNSHYECVPRSLYVARLSWEYWGFENLENIWIFVHSIKAGKVHKK